MNSYAVGATASRKRRAVGGLWGVSEKAAWALRRMPGTNSGPLMSLACRITEVASDKSNDTSKPSCNNQSIDEFDIVEKQKILIPKLHGTAAALQTLFPDHKLRMMFRVTEMLASSGKFVAPVPGSSIMIAFPEIDSTVILHGILQKVT